jgi:hypothetical protein
LREIAATGKKQDIGAGYYQPNDVLVFLAVMVDARNKHKPVGHFKEINARKGYAQRFSTE